MYRTLTAIGIALAFASPAESGCNALSKYGIYDTTVAIDERQRSTAFKHWFCQKKFESETEAESMGAEFGYGGYTFGYDENAESWREFYYSYCAETELTDDQFRKTSVFLQRINNHMVQSLEACLTQKGLHAWIEQSGKDTFRFRTVFNPSRKGERSPKVESFIVQNGTCAGVIKKGRRIGPDGDEMLCRRTTNVDVDILFDASEFVIKDTPLRFAAYFPPPKPPVREKVSIEAINYTTSIQIRPNGGDFVARWGSGFIINHPPLQIKDSEAVYEFSASASGNYALYSTYASAAVRPVEISINGQIVKGAGLAVNTGSWHIGSAGRYFEGLFQLRQGRNTFKISTRNSPIPHILRFEWVPMDP